MAKSKEITLINDGACAVYINKERLLPDEEITVSAEMLENSGVMYMIAKGDLIVKNDIDATKEVKETMSKRKKKDPFEGKTKAQLEDGGEF